MIIEDWVHHFKKKTVLKLGTKQSKLLEIKTELKKWVKTQANQKGKK